MIEVDEQFQVPAPPQQVWTLLADPHAVVGCVPGAAIVGVQDDGTLDTTLTVRFGPVAVAFQARATLELEPDARRGRLRAQGKDRQGGARFVASASFSVAEHDAGSLVLTHGEVDISGRLASMIEGGAAIVVRRMAADFSACL